jgi:hypothetical protein
MLCGWEANHISKLVLDPSIPAPEVCIGIALVRRLQWSAEPQRSEKKRTVKRISTQYSSRETVTNKENLECQSAAIRVATEDQKCSREALQT